MFYEFATTFCYVTLFYVAYKVVDNLFRLPLISSLSSRYVFVTGCDSGFGFETVKRLDKLGCHVFAGCLTGSGEIKLQQKCSDRVKTLRLDVRSEDSIDAAYKYVTDNLPPGKGIWAVFSNAGILGKYGPVEWMRREDYVTVIEVNLLGCIDVVRIFLPLVKMEGGRVVLTSSLAGRCSMPMIAPYCVTKYGLEAFADNLRRQPMLGASVHLIEPGGANTNICYNSNEIIQQAFDDAPSSGKEAYGNIVEQLQVLRSSGKARNTVDSIVDSMIHALTARYPRTRYVAGTDAVVFAKLVSILPEVIADRLMSLLFKINVKKSQ